MKGAVEIPADPGFPQAYWESRARRYAVAGSGLAAVCSYGMPEFYNRAIDWNQRLALAPWLQVRAGTKVLDVGCGVGRWSRLLAARGAEVTGIDISPTMIHEAQRRAAAAGLSQRCRFLVADTSAHRLAERFDLIIGVTVLQHILDPQALRHALSRLVEHARPGARVVLLEAAPAKGTQRCDSAVFQARPRDAYLRLFAAHGLRVVKITGVDPAPFRWRILPHLRRMPRWLRLASVAGATALSLPWELPFGRVAAGASWHAVFVLQAPQEAGACA
jgi:ubiquinone/menaquinone biosynthesis C-methylase UbiE